MLSKIYGKQKKFTSLQRHFQLQPWNPKEHMKIKILSWRQQWHWKLQPIRFQILNICVWEKNPFSGVTKKSFHPFICKGCSCQTQIIVACKFVHISLSLSLVLYMVDRVLLCCFVAGWERERERDMNRPCTSAEYSSRASNNNRAIRNSRRMNSWCHNMNV